MWTCCAPAARPRVFDEVYAPSTVGILLREFTFGHARQLAAVLASIWSRCAARAELLPGSEQRVFFDIDSLLRPVYGHAKQGASFGHTKIAGQAAAAQGTVPAGHHASAPTRRRR